MSRLLVVLALLAGCAEAGSSQPAGGDPVDAAQPPDATPGADTASLIDGAAEQFDDAAVADAAPPPIDASTARCNPTSPFGAPVALAGLNTSASEFSAHLSDDELKIYFGSDRSGGSGRRDIYTASRSSVDQSFGAVVPLAGVNSDQSETSPRVTADGLTLYAEVSRSSWYHIERATRATPASSFGPLSSITVLNSSTTDADPFIAPDGSEIYFSSLRDGNWNLYRATRSGSSFSTPQPLTDGDVTTSAGERYPVLSAAGLSLWFGSDRTTEGDFDIWVATRSSTAEPFGAAVRVDELSSTNLDLPGWSSPDGCALYLARMVGGQFDLYVAERGN